MLLKKQFPAFIFCVFSFCMFLPIRGASQDTIQTQREFRGFIHSDEYPYVRVNIKQSDKELKGVFQYEGQFETINIEGTIDADKKIELYQLNSQNKREGFVIKGRIESHNIFAKYYVAGKHVNIELTEIDLRNPPPFKKPQNAKSPLNSFANNFPDLVLQQELNFDTTARDITKSCGILMNYMINQIGGYQIIRLIDRSSMIKSIRAGGKVNMGNGNKGFLIHVHFQSMQDGNLFASYFYVFNENQEFVQAFVAYEATIIGEPYIKTKVSSSLNFVVDNLGKIHHFKIDDEGYLSFRERD